MNREWITKTEEFLKKTFCESRYLSEYPFERDYRLEHSYRVANISKTIAYKENLNVTLAVIAGLLHDISYCEEMRSSEERMNHGRRSAAIARPFLKTLGLSDYEVNDVCYAIAIHVDDHSDFCWERSSFSETVGDADNIDRFDAYRIYETLQSGHFDALSLEEKRNVVRTTTDRLHALRSMKLGTQTACNLWMERLEYYISFYDKLNTQVELSNQIK